MKEQYDNYYFLIRATYIQTTQWFHSCYSFFLPLWPGLYAASMCLLYLLNQKGLWKCNKIEFNKTWITHKSYVQFLMCMNTWTLDYKNREYCVLHIISHFGLWCQLTDAPYQRRQFISCDYSMNSFTFLIWSWINVNGSRTLILLTETLFLQFVFLNR